MSLLHSLLCLSQLQPARLCASAHSASRCSHPCSCAAGRRIGWRWAICSSGTTSGGWEALLHSSQSSDHCNSRSAPGFQSGCVNSPAVRSILPLLGLLRRPAFFHHPRPTPSTYTCQRNCELARKLVVPEYPAGRSLKACRPVPYRDGLVRVTVRPAQVKISGDGSGGLQSHQAVGRVPAVVPAAITQQVAVGIVTVDLGVWGSQVGAR